MNISSLNTYPSLADQTVLISGGATGIGAAFVESFAKQGSRVAFLDIDDKNGKVLMSRVSAETNAHIAFFPCDLRDVPALRMAIDEVQNLFGPVRVLINNAARDDRHAIDDVTVEDWDELLAVNLRHQFFAIQAIRHGMAEAGGGSIINMGSITSFEGYPGVPAYATAKGGVIGLTRALATELGPDRIRVNAIVPGFIKTKRQVELWLTPEMEGQILEGQCLPGLIDPIYVANMALFLASDDSAMCTAHVYTIDAGLM